MVQSPRLFFSLSNNFLQTSHACRITFFFVDLASEIRLMFFPDLSLPSVVAFAGVDQAACSVKAPFFF